MLNLMADSVIESKVSGYIAGVKRDNHIYVVFVYFTLGHVIDIEFKVVIAVFFCDIVAVFNYILLKVKA